jgi:hypothetical protein
MLVIFASVGIGMGIMEVLYAAQIDDFHRGRGHDSALFRIGARWRGIILIVSGALILFGYFLLFRVDTTP